MDIHESEDPKLSKSSLGGSLDNLRLTDAPGHSDPECTNIAEAMLTSLLEKAVTPVMPGRQAQSDPGSSGSTSGNDIKGSAETEKSKSLFHLSDNMKKDLSLLAFPSKSIPRKKGIISSRAISNARITIAEALEKAEDARKSISSFRVTSNRSDVEKGDTSKLYSEYNSSGQFVDKGTNESLDTMELLPHSDTSGTSRESMKNLDSAVASQSVAGCSSASDTTASESALGSEGNTVLVADKAKSAGSSRVQMTRRMLELLKFTFTHEHFPSSVQLARLGKMMGMPWSQVRNWFTDRRVDNKRAGIYLRDRPLVDCPYCDVTLQTEAEQKSHLFSALHIKRILGPEYCGGGSSESIKWKKLPKTVNAVSTISGARILAVGFTADDKKGKKIQEKKKMESPLEKPHSRELKKLWTDAMLPPEEKEQPTSQWNPARTGMKKNLDSHFEPYMQGKREASFNLEIRDQKNKVFENTCGRKVVVNSRVAPIAVNLGDMILGTASSNLPATVNNATTTSNMMGMNLHDSNPVNQNVSSVIPGDMHIKPNIGAVFESPAQSRRHTVLSSNIPLKAYRGAIPKHMMPMNKSTGLTSELPSLANINRKKKPSKYSLLKSVYTQDYETKQEPEINESYKSILYKGDGSSGQRKHDMPVVNANKQSFSGNQNSGFCVPNSLKSLRLQKTTSLAHDQLVVKSGGLTDSKISRTIADKRKVRLRTQPLGSVFRAKTTSLANEGNIILGYQCPSCNKVFQTEWLMMKHSVTHFKYHCDICYQVYPTENMMKIHLLDHLSGAYEDEKYYCQFSCKVCHSLKCGCYEPTYCKPQDLPRIFLRPQKAKRSKRGFITKLNSGPNDHLKISLSSYKKLLLSESLGNTSKEKLQKATSPNLNQTSPKPVLEDAPKILVLKDQKEASAADTQLSTIVVREAPVSNTSADKHKNPNLESETGKFMNVERETSPTSPAKERDLGSVADVSSEQSEVRSNVCTVEEKKITESEKPLHWTQMKRKFTNYKNDTNPSPQALCPHKHEGAEGAPSTKKAEDAPSTKKAEDAPSTKKTGNRKRTTKLSNNFTYKDTDFYYMCEVCDASFSHKAELSEHMFLHRLKLRTRRGEKRGISLETIDTVVRKKAKKDAAIPEIPTCEVCLSKFPTMTDYRAHKILAHNEPKPQDVEVYRCNYCDKIYRRRRELKRHLKRDCVFAPSSLKGKLSVLKTDEIEESHYTTMKVNMDDKAESPTKFVAKGASRGPIVCTYCLAVTKREAEMKRHIWKFCLKVPQEVVKKFMNGASLDDLGFKYIKEEDSVEATPTEISQNTHTEVSGTESDVMDSMNDTQTMQNKDFSEKSSPEKHILLDVKTPVSVEPTKSLSTTKTYSQKSPNKRMSVPVELHEASNKAGHALRISSGDTKITYVPVILPEKSSTTSLWMPTDKKICTVPEHQSLDTNTEKEKTIAQENALEDANTTKSLQKESSYVQSLLSQEQSVSTIPAKGSEKADTEKQTPTKSLTEETKMEPVCGDEVAQPAASTSPLASPVMEFPVPLPVIIPANKSKRPLVCGYCGIWYFRETAILKHMKERCIKISDLEKDILKSTNALVNVSQRPGGISIAPESGAVYKMVNMPEHLQNTPPPIPKDVSNEDIKKLRVNTNLIKPSSETTSTESKPMNESENTSPPPVSSPATPVRNTTSKKGLRCRRCHDHFSSPEAVLAHSSVHHGPKKGFYKCKLCNARMVKYKQLREHVWEHTNESPYRCHLCDVRYRTSDVLVEHLLTQHQYTSINDKNLYKWLPGRHGRYRDIKTKNSNCEEKLDDVDTNLESLAEVMVVTDKDICSNANRDSINMDDKMKVTNNSINLRKQLDDENMKEKSLSQEVENNGISNETKVPPANSDGTKNRDSTVDNTSEDIILEKTGNLTKGESTPTEESSAKILDGSASVKSAALQEDSENKEQTSTESSTCIESENGPKEQCDKAVNEEMDVDKDPEQGIVDGFTGEGLLPLVENLDSIVETVHLTDKHLS